MAVLFVKKQLSLYLGQTLRLKISRNIVLRKRRLLPGIITGLIWRICLDSLTTSYVDTLDDDGNFQYRVRIVDQRDQYRHELSEEFVVPNISSLYIPDHYVHLETAFDTKFIDNGDSIIFRPGCSPWES